ncbi:MAG: hypothetical protein QM706_20610 [Nitrospira sp.]
MPVTDFFLTAFDPSDLPGTSIDPLGFDRGYNFLADKILPGLTNVADRPRYFGMLCAGVVLAGADNSDPPLKLYSDRRDAVLRLERLWALANVLASEEGLRADGIRGISYVLEERRRLQRAGSTTASARFKLLSRQAPYGVLGIYGAIAEGLRFFVERKTFTLSPDAGDALAHAFIDETQMPASVRRAVKDDTEVGMSVLASWGKRAHISASPAGEETRYLSEALHRNYVRSRTVQHLASIPPQPDEPELARIRRIHRSIPDNCDDVDLKNAFEAILEFEDCYRILMLGFERLLWLCRSATTAVLPHERFAHDKVVKKVCDLLPAAAKRLGRAFENGRTEHLRSEMERIEDVLLFIDRAATISDNPSLLCKEMLARHNDVQHAKFDRGRRKMPWVECVGGGLALTTTRAGGLNFEAQSPDEIAPHPYRLPAADALLAVSITAP